MHTGRILPLIIILIFCCKSRLKSPCIKHCGQFFGKFAPLPHLFDVLPGQRRRLRGAVRHNGRICFRRKCCGSPASDKKKLPSPMQTRAVVLFSLFIFMSVHSSSSAGSEFVSQSMLPPFERSFPSKSSSFSASKREKPATIAAEATSSSVV